MPTLKLLGHHATAISAEGSSRRAGCYAPYDLGKRLVSPERIHDVVVYGVDRQRQVHNIKQPGGPPPVSDVPGGRGVGRGAHQRTAT